MLIIFVQMSPRSYLLRCISRIVSAQTFILIYKTFILPSLDYADTIWTTCNVFLSQKVQRLQNRAARIILKNSDYDNTSSIDLIT